MTSLFVRSLRLAAGTALALTSAATIAHADTIINVVNGGFESTTLNKSSEFGGRYSSQQVTGWTTNGYNFVFKSGTADTTGAVAESGPIVKLYGPGDGTNNGLPASSPDGGNFLAMNPVYFPGALSQTLYGFTPGLAATVSFYFAGAQQTGYNGATTEGFDVSLGSETLSTPILHNASHGFTGWVQESLTFIPTSSSETLSFLAIGGPGGDPPNVLLDGVSVSQVPEPSSLALLGTGIAGISGLVRRRFKR